MDLRGESSNNMGRKCCIIHYKGNYDEENKTKIFRLPSAKTKHTERQRWIKTIPNTVPNSKDTSICEKHWPTNYETVSVNGKLRPRDPPSIFSGVPQSVIPTPPSKPRTTESIFDFRTKMDDQYEDFKTRDVLKFDHLKGDIPSHKFSTSFVCYRIESTIHIQSSRNFNDGVPLFLLKIHREYKFRAFRAGVRCGISTLMKNRITMIYSWSKLEEAIRFLQHQPLNKQKLVIKEHLESIVTHKPGEKVYNTETIVRAFKYYATS